jgi:LysM repeat protein
MNRKSRVSWGLPGLLLVLLAATLLGCSRERPQIDNSTDWQKLTPSAPGTSPVITTTLVPEVVATQVPATVPTTVVVTIPSESWSYIIQAGDTMSSIAQRFGTEVAVLVALNGITDAAQIQVGQTLKIPGQKPANVTTVSGGNTAGRHVVQRGETLSQIARRYNTTVAELQRLNNLANPGLIVAGQVIQLPSGTTGSSTTTGGQQTYVVKRGDTLSQIAERFGVSTTDLAQANGITNPRLIYAGQQLIIP